MREQLESILARIRMAASRVGRNPSEITVTAVTKGVSPDRICEFRRIAIDLGIRPVIGESYLSEWTSKMEFIDPGLEKRFIGALTPAQVPRIWRLFDVIETIGDERTLEVCVAQKKKGGNIPRLLLQVNISADPKKAGFSADAVPDAMRMAHNCGLPISGFMAITEQYEAGAEAVRRDYRALASLATVLRNSGDFFQEGFEIGRTDLSMGMSEDFEIAVEEGATHVRLGSILFGPRAPV
jgi:uncharacterized pyridoxal phosphate-containing UPF0001 family protein